LSNPLALLKNSNATNAQQTEYLLCENEVKIRTKLSTVVVVDDVDDDDKDDDNNNSIQFNSCLFSAIT
jgi:hypothetical protein